MKEMEQRRKGPMVRMGAFLGIGKGEKEHRVACDYGEPPLRSIFLFSIFFSVYGIFFLCSLPLAILSIVPSAYLFLYLEQFCI
jgi:hypothetical protein